MRDQDPSFQTLDPVDCLSCSVKREIRLSYQNIAETHWGCVLLTRRTRLIQVTWKFALYNDVLFCYPQVTWHTSDPCLVVLPDRKSSEHWLQVLCWFLPCSSLTRRSDMWLGDEGKWVLTCTFNWNKCIWQVIQLRKHDNRIDPQEAPTSLLFRNFLDLHRYTVVAFSKWPHRWSSLNNARLFLANYCG